MGSNPQCPLCQKSDTFHFSNVKTKVLRKYFRCCECDLIFCDRLKILSPEVEKDRYTAHHNNEKTAGYVSFLRKLLDPMTQRCVRTAKGLDYGSGPFPMMAEVARDLGYYLEIYDPYFAPNYHLLKQKYDFLLCCEVAEHFSNPNIDFEQMINLLNPRGFLGVMTKFFDDAQEFENWSYVKDDTHISLYTEKTIQWIATKWDLSIDYLENNVAIFQKN